jgi:hypothetical protein
MEKDVTRKAAERAALTMFRAREKLQSIITTGPASVRLTPSEAQRQVADGNTRLLRYSMEQMDDDLLVKMLAGSLAERNKNATN